MLLPAAVILVVMIVVFGPQWWVRHVMARYDAPIEALPGTGGELARHLITTLSLKDVSVSRGEPGENHYDPQTCCVSLSPEVHDGKSLTAVAISAHEIGHALQHQQRFRPLLLRTRLAVLAARAERLAALILICLPALVLITRLPQFGGLVLVTGIGILFLPLVLHLVTLPVEFDASFRRALPILIQGRYLPAAALKPIRRILLAAALTYVSASLASLLNFWRWLVILRR